MPRLRRQPGRTRQGWSWGMPALMSRRSSEACGCSGRFLKPSLLTRTQAAAVAQWSGIAFGATFLGAGLVAPLWGKLADLYGRKPILIRASLGMAVTMSLIGTVHTVWQLVLLRLLAGLLGGYSSGAVVLVATQTPKGRVAWALG